jgi:hypothetical protein
MAYQIADVEHREVLLGVVSGQEARKKVPEHPNHQSAQILSLDPHQVPLYQTVGGMLDTLLHDAVNRYFLQHMYQKCSLGLCLKGADCLQYH